VSERILWPVPNALDERRPVPILFSPSLWLFLVFVSTIFGGLIVSSVSISLHRPLLSDLSIFLQICLIAALVVSFKPGGHTLVYWLGALGHMALMRFLGRLSWGFLPMRAKDEALPGGKPKVGSVVVSATWAHVLYENTRVLEDGILDVSGIPLLPTWLRWIIATITGRAAFRAVIDPGISAFVDLEDQPEVARLKSVRSSFWFRLNQIASAHAIVRPLDPEEIAYCAGPEEDAARALALGQLGQSKPLIDRCNYLVVQGATRWMLRANIKRAVSTLSEHGRAANILKSAELERILADEWGPRHKIPLEINHTFVRVGTKRMVSFLITRLERNVPLDWILGLLDGSIPGARVALFQRPVLSGGLFGALAQLQWRIISWRAAQIGFSGRQYDAAVADAERVQDEIREPSGKLHRWGIVLTVPEEHKEYAEDQLKARYVTQDGWRPAVVVQDHAAKASLPIGLDKYVDLASTNSSTLALSTPWTGTKLWRPARNGKARTVLIGYALPTAEIVGWDLFDNADDAGQEAWNSFAWGMMGDGKTTFMQMVERRVCKPHPNHYLYEMKPRGLFIDHKPDLEYGGLVRDLGGEYVIATSWDDVKDLNVEQAALGINVSLIHPRQRGKFVYDIIRKVMDGVAKRPVSEPWPGIIGIDEMHMLALTEDGRWVISELGKMVRSAMFAVMFGTQDMDDVLRRDETAGIGADGMVASAIKNASCRVALRQPSMSHDLLRERLQMSEGEVSFLTNMASQDGGEITSSRGKCIVWAHGRKAPTQIVPLGREREVFARDPQDRLAMAEKSATLFGNEGAEDSGSTDSSVDGLLAGHAGDAARRVKSNRVAAARLRSRRYRSR
jgi:hypothetical protein